LALYRGELQRAADDLNKSRAAVDETTQFIQRLLPSALEAGVAISEAAQITGLSRATLYRLLADARRQQNLTGLVTQLEGAVGQLAETLDRPPLPADLRSLFNVSLEEVFEMLMQAYLPLSQRAASLEPMEVAALGDLIPTLGTPEKVVLNMLIFQRLPVAAVSKSAKLTKTQVMAWAALGLLRILPALGR
jgi:hypothetical protein